MCAPAFRFRSVEGAVSAGQSRRTIFGAVYSRIQLSAFHERTDVPMLLNTSFKEIEPIVCQPEEAVDCFLRTDMDVLVLGPWVARKQRVDAGASESADGADAV